MVPDVREKARKLRGKLCTLAEEYKGVKPEACQECESPCGYGMERPEQEAGKKETFAQDRRMRRIIRGMNRSWRMVRMKTHEQIKAELTAWGTGITLDYEDGTFRPPGFFQGTVAEVCRDALACIQQLEEDLQRERDQNQYTVDAANVMKDEALKLESRLAQVVREAIDARELCAHYKEELVQAERERDAAVNELAHSVDACFACKRTVEERQEKITALKAVPFLNGAAFARKTPMLSPACKSCPAYSIYCEYDPLTDTIYPADENACLVLKNEKEENKHGEINAKSCTMALGKHPDTIMLIQFGHTEMFTPEMNKQYLAWCQTDEGRKYLKGGNEYKEE